jgi:hypothetical protein
VSGVKPFLRAILFMAFQYCGKRTFWQTPKHAQTRFDPFDAGAPIPRGFYPDDTAIFNAKAQRFKGAARQAATKEPEQEETEKTEGKNFAENAEFSQIALQRRKVLFPALRLCSAIHENCAFLAKFSELSFEMTNDKFSMTNFQFRLSDLVAACRAASLQLCVETSFLS